MAEQLLRILAGILVGIWVARYLGPEKFGLLNYILAITAILSSIAKLGLDSIILRECINKPEAQDLYLGTGFWLKVISATATIALTASILQFISNDGVTNIYILIVISGLVFQSFEVVAFYFQSRVLAKVVTICKVVQLTLSSAIKIYLVIVEAELIWFVVSTVFDAAFLAVGYIISYRIERAKIFFGHFDFGIALRMLKDSLPLMFGGLSFALFTNVDSIIINKIMGESAVGIYSAANKLTVMWHFLPGLILSSLMPAIAKSKINKALYDKRRQVVTSFLVWFSIVLAIFVSLTSSLLVKYSFGGGYSESASILAVLIWTNVFIFFNSCWNSFHVINNQTKYVFYFHTLTAVINVILNVILISYFGLIGASFAIIGALLISLLIFIFVDKTTLPLILGSLTFGKLGL